MTLVYVGAGVAGLCLVAALVWWLRHRITPRIEGPEEAADAADRALAGFTTLNAVDGADGTGALAVTDDGRVAAIKRRGAQLAVREVSWDLIRATANGMLVESGDRHFGAVLVAGVNALDIRRLAPHLTRASS